MSTNGKKITAPVSLKEACTLTGTAAIGGKLSLRQLCTGGKIASYCKYKPERINSQKAVSFAQRAANNFGLVPMEVLTSVDALLGCLDSDWEGKVTGSWGYNPPRKDTDYCRLGDFNGYRADIVYPFLRLSDTEIQVPASGSTRLRVDMTSTVEEESVKLAEFAKTGAAYRDWYAGLVVSGVFGTYLATATETLRHQSADAWPVDLGMVGNGDVGGYTALAFISSKRIELGGEYPTGIEIIPLGEPVTVTVLANVPDYVIDVKATYDRSGSDIKVKVSVTQTNNTDAEVRFEGITLRAAKDNKGSGAVTLGVMDGTPLSGGESWTDNVTYNFTSKFGSVASAMRYVKASCDTPLAGETVWKPILEESKPAE